MIDHLSYNNLQVYPFGTSINSRDSSFCVAHLIGVNHDLAHASRWVINRENGVFEILDGLDVEALQTVRRQVLFDELGEFEKRLFDHRDWVPCYTMYFLIVPNTGVKFPQLSLFNRFEEIWSWLIILARFLLMRFSLFLTLHVVLLKNVDCYDARAGRNLWWTVLQKHGIIQLEFTNLVAHVVHCPILVVLEDAQEPFKALYRSRKVVVKAHFDQNIGLKVNQTLLGNIFLFIFRQQINHPCKTGRDRLLKFSCHQHRYGGKSANLVSRVCLPSDDIQVTIQNGCSYE